MDGGKKKCVNFWNVVLTFPFNYACILQIYLFLLSEFFIQSLLSSLYVYPERGSWSQQLPVSQKTPLFPPLCFLCCHPPPPQHPCGTFPPSPVMHSSVTSAGWGLLLSDSPEPPKPFECSRTTDDTGNFRCEIPLSLTSFANPLQIELLLSYKGLNPVGFLLVLKTDTQNWPTLHNQIFTIRFSSHLCPGEPSWAVGVKKASSQLLHSSLLESARPRYSQVSLKRQNDPPDLLSPRHQGPQLTRLGYRLLFLPFVPSPFNQLNISDASHTWSFSSFIPYTTEHSQSPHGP